MTTGTILVILFLLILILGFIASPGAGDGNILTSIMFAPILLGIIKIIDWALSFIGSLF
jgi:hypothetical protein